MAAHSCIRTLTGSVFFLMVSVGSGCVIGKFKKLPRLNYNINVINELIRP